MVEKVHEGLNMSEADGIAQEIRSGNTGAEMPHSPIKIKGSAELAQPRRLTHADPAIIKDE